jgi:hypothetical protein
MSWAGCELREESSVSLFVVRNLNEEIDMKKSLLALAALAALGAVVPVAQATENGGSTYPAAENYLMGAAPPPGFYVLGYGNVYSSTTLKDGNSNTIAIPGFKVNVNVAVARFVWSTDKQVMGGNLLVHTIIPMVDLTTSTMHKTGIGDITVGAGVAFHHSQSLHSVIALDVVAPTGSYSVADGASNIGRNYTSVQPTYLVSYINPTGFNGDFKVTYNANQKNSSTQYQSGDELFVDYSAGYGLGNGWTVGVGGYWTQQVADDTGSGATSGANRKAGSAIGPSVRYMSPNHWFVTAKFQQEQNMRNTTEGSAFWIKGLIPF